MNKRLTLILTLVCACALLCSCIFFRDPTPWEEGKEKDTLFSAELLAQKGIEDMPLPAPENVYLDGEALYCNMTREEYEAYVQSVIEYLGEREGIYHVGYKYDTTMGSFFGFPPYWTIYEYAPMIEGYDVSAEYHRFIYSLNEEIEMSYGEAKLNGYSNIGIEWCPTTPDNSEFSYTVRISLASDKGYEYHPCYHSHDYLEVGAYPVAGSEKIITFYECTRCGRERRSEYVSGDGKFNITVVEGGEYVYDCDEQSYDNMIVTLTTFSVPDAELKVVANGVELPRTKADFNFWSYVFIMPAEDVEISVTIVGDNEEYPYFSALGTHEAWLGTINAENVELVSIEAESLSSPTDAKIGERNSNEKAIESFLTALKQKKLRRCSDISLDGMEVKKTVTVLMKDGTSYSLCVYDGKYYFIDGICYEMEFEPSLAAYVGTENYVIQE